MIIVIVMLLFMGASILRIVCMNVEYMGFYNINMRESESENYCDFGDFLYLAVFLITSIS